MYAKLKPMMYLPYLADCARNEFDRDCRVECRMSAGFRGKEEKGRQEREGRKEE